MSKRILIDIDGTVADWEQRFINLMTEHHPSIPLLPHGTRTQRGTDLAREKSIRSHPGTQAVLAMPGFYRNLEWYDGAKEAILKLQEDGHDIYFCSMPSKLNPTSASEKLQWVKDGLGEGWAERVILTYRKGLVDGDILIDDHIHRRSDTTRWTQILYHQSYNANMPIQLRLNGWTDYNLLTETIRQS